MGDILRRRGMMAAAEEATDLLYSLYNYSDRTKVETNVSVLQQDMDVTIVMDITVTSNPTSSNATSSIYKLFVLAGDNSYRALCIGKYQRGHTYLTLWWMATSGSDGSQLTGSTAAAGRKRFVVTHEANSNTVTVYSKMGSGDVNTQTKTRTFVTTSNSMKIGDSTTQQLPAGTIDKVEIYNRIWTAAERDAFFAD